MEARGRAGWEEEEEGGKRDRGADKRQRERLYLKDERAERRRHPQVEDVFRSEMHFDKKGNISTVINSKMEQTSQRCSQKKPE